MFATTGIDHIVEYSFFIQSEGIFAFVFMRRSVSSSWLSGLTNQPSHQLLIYTNTALTVHTAAEQSHDMGR
jgi:hypothetical protein